MLVGPGLVQQTVQIVASNDLTLLDIHVQALRDAESTNIPFLAALMGALRRCNLLV